MTKKWLTKAQWSEIYHQIYFMDEEVTKVSRDFGITRNAIYLYARRHNWDDLKHKIFRFIKRLFS